jgi:hypothetical protein
MLVLPQISAQTVIPKPALVKKPQRAREKATGIDVRQDKDLDPPSSIQVRTLDYLVYQQLILYCRSPCQNLG